MMDSLKKMSIPANTGQQIPVYITKVVSVDKVYIRFISHMDDYVPLMSEMKHYYEGKRDITYVKDLPEGDDTIKEKLFILKREEIYNRARIKEIWPDNCYYVELLDEGFTYLATEKELILNDNPKFLNKPVHGFEFSLDFYGRHYDTKKNYLINYGLQKIVNTKQNFFITLSSNSSSIKLYYLDKSTDKRTCVNDYLFAFFNSIDQNMLKSDEIVNVDTHLSHNLAHSSGGDVGILHEEKSEKDFESPELIVEKSATNVESPVIPKSPASEPIFSVSVPRFEFTPEDALKMKCKHVFNPSEFYLKLPKSPEFKKFIEELNKYYSENAPEHPPNVLVNNLYITNFKNKWIRLLILGVVNQTSFYSCLLFDKGIVGTISYDDIFSLDGRFKKMPPRAVKAALAFIKPTTEKWAKEANDYFKQLLKGSQLEVYPINYDEDGVFYCSLVKDDNNISDLLEQEGFATIEL